MHKPTPKSAFFTLAEIMVACSIMVIMMAATIPFAMGILRSYMIARVHDDIQRKADTIGDQLKRDLLCTSKHEVMFVPTDGTSFRAMSFPVLRRPLTDDTAPIDAATGGVAWTEWVVWHVYGTYPEQQMRRTVVKPFPSSLTWDQRKAMTMQILTNGGAGGLSGITSTLTRTMAKKLDSYAFGLRESETDAYAPALTNEATSLGVIVLAPGEHTLKWKVTNKNTASSSYNLNIDTFTIGAVGLPVEMEHYLPIGTYSGPTPVFQNMSAYPVWSNNAQITFPANAAGQYYQHTWYNDTWVESNFNESGTLLDNTKVTSFADGTSDMVVELLGNGTGWDPSTQTGAAISGCPDDYSGATIRVLVAGADPILTGSIGYGGRQCRVGFNANPNWGLLYIQSAYIMERDGTAGFNGKTGTLKQISFNGAIEADNYSVFNDGESCYLGTNGRITSGLVDFEINKHKDYLISFHIGLTGDWYGGQISEYVPPATIAQAAAEHAAVVFGDMGNAAATNLNWEPHTPTLLNKVLAVSKVFVTYPESATFDSQIVDTRLDDPAYNKMRFVASVPAGTGIGVKVRSGDMADMSDASSWDSISAMTGNGSETSISGIGAGRYVQFQAVLSTTAPYTSTPSLRDVRITWPGQNRAVELSANLAKGPTCGKFQLLIDDRTPAFAGVQVLAVVGQKFLGKSYQAKSMVDIDPRNP